MISKLCPRILVVTLFALPAIRAMAAEAPSAASLYAEHCAQCHNADRLGAMGPALVPENLGRLKRNDAQSVIRDGRTATQMPGFRDKSDVSSRRTGAGRLFPVFMCIPPASR